MAIIHRMRPIDFKSHAICLVLTLGLVTACGYAEWPPRDEQPRDINASASATPAPASASARSFIGATAVIVGPGDTVYALSKRHQIPMQALIRANGLTAPFVLQVGQRLQLPRVRAHKVVRGDTLFGIANAYDVNAFELARINDLKKPYVIHVGESLIMPSDSDAAKTQMTRSRQTDPQTIAQSSANPAPAAADTNRAPAAPAWVAPPKIETAQAVKTPAPRIRQALAKPPPKSRQGFLWPVRGKIISTFGVKSKGLRNDGINIQARRGNPVYAAEHGVVAYAGNELRGFGNLLLIKHADGWVTAYAHNETLLVKRGDTIKRGQKIATIGSTGSVTSPQLHFEIRRGNKARDPKTLLQGEA